MTRSIICANWKMYQSFEASLAYLPLLSSLIPTPLNYGVEIYIAPSFLAIPSLIPIAKKMFLSIGGQNIAPSSDQPLTGEISGSMLREVGARFTIIGHLERRSRLNEDDALIRLKIETALANSLEVILCIGETLQERENGAKVRRIVEQLDHSFKGLSPDLLSKVVIAYEPFWTIGQAYAAPLSSIREALLIAKNHLGKLFGEMGFDIPLLYGGAVNEANVKEISQLNCVDGLLVGRASVNPSTFATIIAHFTEGRGIA